MEDQLKYAPAPEAIFNKIDDEVVIMSLANDAYINLNEVGSRIWELLAESPRTIDDLVLTLIDEFEVTEEQCREDVTIFLKEMLSKGLVETHS
jgi:hypothetical protein